MHGNQFVAPIFCEPSNNRERANLIRIPMKELFGRLLGNVNGGERERISPVIQLSRTQLTIVIALRILDLLLLKSVPVCLLKLHI